MHSDINKAKELLDKYQRGKCTEAEKAILRNWYDQINLSSGTSNPLHNEALRQRLEAAILHRINSGYDDQKLQVKKAKSKLVHLFRNKAAVAAIIFLIVAGGSFLFLSDRIKKTTLTPFVYTVYNDASSPKKITLPDGSTVWLNARSTLRWKKEFGQKYRQVALDGEGFFEVMKDAAHPFLVTAKTVTTRVTGTAFNVEAYSWENQVRVALLKGSVELSSETKNIRPGGLQPGQTGSLRTGSNSFDIRQEDVSGYASWTDGRTYFKETPLKIVLERICRQHGYVLQGSLSPEDEARPVTIHFENDQSAEDMLSGILYINHIDFTIQQKTIVLK